MLDIYASYGDDAAEEKAASSLQGKLFLVGLGAQKAGSTWMARYLATHPQVYVPRLKEIHYFDAVYMSRLNGHVPDRMARLAKEIADDMAADGGKMSRKKFDRLRAVIDRLQMTADRKYRYLQFFEDRVTDESVFCDITPAYSILDVDGYEAILKTHPDVRFVFIMRDPIDRFWSAIRMGMRKIDGFQPYQRFLELLESEEHIRRTDYKRTILELEKVASPDQVKYFFFENFFTTAAMDELTSFIGVRTWPASFDKVVNPGEKMPLDPQHFAAALKKFRHVYEFVFERFGDATPARWRTSAAALASAT